MRPPPAILNKGCPHDKQGSFGSGCTARLEPRDDGREVVAAEDDSDLGAGGGFVAVLSGFGGGGIRGRALGRRDSVDGDVVVVETSPAGLRGRAGELRFGSSSRIEGDGDDPTMLEATLRRGGVVVVVLPNSNTSF